jgi:hypothetical protein
MALKPCLDCGRLAQGFRCQICATIRNRTNPYGTPAWRRLSAAVTAGDGACVDCGSTEHLHTPITTSHGLRAALTRPRTSSRSARPATHG